MGERAARSVSTDPDRLRAVRRLSLPAVPDDAFDRFAALVELLLGAPVALVSVVDAGYQILAGQVGLPEPWATSRTMPLTAPTRQVVESGQPVAVAEIADDGLGVAAFAGVPLTDADGRTLGVLAAADREPRRWTGTELALLTDLAAACSSELRLRIARRLADDARRRAEAAHDQLAMLAELTGTLATTLDVDEALRRLAAAVTPRLADRCGVTLVDDDGRHRPVAGSCPGPPQVTVPIPAPVTGRVLGMISLRNDPSRPPLTAADERVAADIARRAGLALENSRLYGRHRHVAEVLQRSMLTELPTIPGVELHARYLPAEDGAAVGGDWYDAFAQPDGSVMLAVGDVSGHDIEAAATMGQLRNLVRGDAYGRDDEPGALLSHVDRAACGLGVPAPATMVLARVDRDTVSFANAGHPPPILLRPDGEVEVWWVPPEPLLAVIPRDGRATHRRRTPAGSTLVLYTDGLVEEPGRLIDVGIARVVECLRGQAGVGAEELCARLVEAAPRRADDIALLLVRLGG
jgi:serine phosphatase RsbU (regulator of sigma subunit)